MNSKVMTLFLVLAAVFAVEAELTGSVVDTLRIVLRACTRFDIVDEDHVQKFFACYDQAPGKTEFLKCQNQELGRTLDSKANLRKTCMRLDKFPGYASCLKTEMAATGVDQADAVAKVNACQGRALEFKD